jgi:hypothetical protein
VQSNDFNIQDSAAYKNLNYLVRVGTIRGRSRRKVGISLPEMGAISRRGWIKQELSAGGRVNWNAGVFWTAGNISACLNWRRGGGRGGTNWRELYLNWG